MPVFPALAHLGILGDTARHKFARNLPLGHTPPPLAEMTFMLPAMQPVLGISARQPSIGSIDLSWQG
jgi:hypothetical protein